MVYMCSVCGCRHRGMFSKCRCCGSVPFIIFSSKKGFGLVSIKVLLRSFKKKYERLRKARIKGLQVIAELK